jgi:PKHD-type hydroxylase
MFLTIPDLLSAAEVTAIQQAARTMPFGDGRATAGRYAQMVEADDQAGLSPALDALYKKISGVLTGHPVFASAVRPRVLTRLILSRYEEGQTYGSHVDDALMQGLRTDVSFTLFLSDPAIYDGGELIVQDTLEDRAIRLTPGSLVIYPSTSLHRVAPVTRGTRLAVVGWAQSWVRSAEKREILFDLDRSIAALDAGDLRETLLKTRSNLLRMWAAD